MVVIEIDGRIVRHFKDACDAIKCYNKLTENYFKENRKRVRKDLPVLEKGIYLYPKPQNRLIMKKIRNTTNVSMDYYFWYFVEKIT